MPWDNRGMTGIKEERKERRKGSCFASCVRLQLPSLAAPMLLGVLLKEHQHAVGIGLGQGV